jgi:formyl-CoA transferase
MSMPLEGLTVVDLGQIYAAPYCALLLAHLGARVVKVEPPGGDALRTRGSDRASDRNSINFELLNAGKESVVLDLKTASGRASLLEMVRHADALVHNMAPGTAERLKVGYADLREVNPLLVYGAITGYGADTDRGGEKAMDLTIQAVTAVMSITGYAGQPPVKAGPALADFAGGSHMALGIAAALVGRERTGCGAFLTVSLQDAVIPTLSSNIAGWFESGGSLPERVGNEHGGLAQAPYNAYPARDGWIALLCLTEAHWLALTAAVGRPELATDPSYATSSARLTHRHELDQLLAQWTRDLTRQELVRRLHHFGVPAAPVETLAELIAAEGRRADPMLVTTVDEGGPRITLGSPVRAPELDPRRLWPAPRLGEHTRAVLNDFAGELSCEMP